MSKLLNTEVNTQIKQSLYLLKDILGNDLLGMYLYGSAVVGGLQKYSDIDLFVVANRSTIYEEKLKLANSLLSISGIYMKSTKRPVELLIVVKSEINPWHYPPIFDFQYGDWLRQEFERGNPEPWKTKNNPDLALIITKVLLAYKTIYGYDPKLLLSPVPYRDFMTATIESLDGLMSDLDRDTRNVLLTLARIWCTVTTDTIRSKPKAVTWALARLPTRHQPVLDRAKAICLGKEKENWDDIKNLIEPCANFILSEINKQIDLLDLSNGANKTIKLV